MHSRRRFLQDGLFGFGAVHFLNGPLVAALLGRVSGQATVASRDELALVDVAVTSRAILADEQIGGPFGFRSGDFSREVDSDPARGIFVAPASDPSGASGAWVRELDGGIELEWFDQSKGRDFSLAFDHAAALGIMLEREIELRASTYPFKKNAQWPAGLTVRGLGERSVLRSEGAHFLLASGISIVGATFDLNNRPRQVIATGAENIRLIDCQANRGKHNGFFFQSGCRDITFERCVAAGNAKSGFVVAGDAERNPRNILIRECKAHGNKRHGISVSGIGETVSRAANYARGVRIIANHCHDNGNTAFSGIVFPYCRDAFVADNFCHDNREHGISCQESSNFTITRNTCHGNGEAGVNMQSGYRPFRPSAEGVVRDNRLYQNKQGIALKENCRDITITRNKISDNSEFGIELIDLGGSRLKSDRIVIEENDVKRSGWRGFANRNRSTNVRYSRGADGSI